MPSDLDSAVNLAIQRQQAGDLASAEALYGQVLMLNPQHAVSLYNLGTIRHQRGDHRAALDLIGAAIKARPLEALYHSALGVVRDGAGDPAGAVTALREAIRLKSDDLQAWESIGIALEHQQQFDEAIAAHRKALSIDAGSRRSRGCLYNLLRDAGQMDEAEALYEAPLAANPLDADYVVKRGMARLRHGDFGGWREYAWGHWSPEWLRADRPVLVPLPQWDGQALPDSGLLLYGEQGIGDEIMFASLVPLAAARAAHTVLLCEPRLVALFARSFPGLRVAARPPAGQPPLLGPETGCNWRCSLTRLPAVLGVDESGIKGTAYLRADANAVQVWRQRLAKLGAAVVVGLSWRGGGNDRTRATRSVPLAVFASLFALPEFRFVNVQYGAHGEEIEACNARFAQPLESFDDIDPLRDMDGLAALLSALDCVVTVDNSTAHLAGALGVPALMLCPFNPDWRWMRQRENSPWYDSLRILRQQGQGGESWQPVVARAVEQLKNQLLRAPNAEATPAVSVAAPALPALASAPTALLINDTTYWYHWGCSGTSLALHAGLRAAGHVVDSVPIMVVNSLDPLPASADELDDPRLFERFRERNPALIERIHAVSEVVINGESSIHGMGRNARALLYLAWLSRHHCGKRTSILNHSCFPGMVQGSQLATAFYRKVYEALDFVAVRDAASAAELARLGVESVQAFDCLPLFIAAHPPALRGQEQRVVLSGCAAQTPALLETLVNLAELVLERGYRLDILVGAAAFIAADDVHLMAALHPRLRERYRLVAATSERQWLDTLAGADLLISGRFHHSIAAACLGTPFVVTGNSSEMSGLIDSLGLPPGDLWISPGDIAQARVRVSALLEDGSRALVPEARMAILREMAQRNFAGLAPPAHRAG